MRTPHSETASPLQDRLTKAGNLGCPDQPKSDNELIRLGQEAWTRLTSCQSWNDWLLVGEALLVGRTECMRVAHTNKPEGRRYNEEFSSWLKATKFDGIDKSTRSRLFECLTCRSDIEKWRKTLPTSERLKLNYPTAVLRRWRNTQVRKPNDAEPKPSAMAKLKTANIELQEQIHRLQRDSEHSVPFTPRDTPKDIAGYVWRTIHEAPKLARSIARDLTRLAKEAEKADTDCGGDQ